MQSMRRRSQRRFFLALAAGLASVPASAFAASLVLASTAMLTLDAAYEAWAHDGQLEPDGEGWRVWMMMAGRGDELRWTRDQ